ncbi:hypothetical protein ACH41E_17850 [Streptomyces sp. NPDC020412]|uniref:hypothetical protein n=1 Tax=Streptomyces sp. NPDC020412 TaxID=3365073 RepID=UPI0037AFF171
MERGTLYASVARQPRELGKIAVRNAIEAAGDGDVPGEVKVPVQVDTARNVAGATASGHRRENDARP